MWFDLVRESTFAIDPVLVPPAVSFVLTSVGAVLVVVEVREGSMNLSRFVSLLVPLGHVVSSTPPKLTVTFLSFCMCKNS